MTRVVSRTRIDASSFASPADAIASAATGHEVVISRPTEISNKLELVAGCRLVGEGDDPRIVAAASFPDNSMVTTLGRDDIHLADLTLDGASQSGFDGLNCSSSDNLEVVGVTVVDLHSRLASAFTGSNVTNSTFDRCSVTSAGRGLWLRGASQHVDVTRLHTRKTPAYGLSVTATSSASIASFIRILDCDIAEVANQSWSGTDGPRHSLYFSSGGTGGFDHCQVVGNKLVGNYSAFVDGTGTADHLAVYDLSHSIVARNQVYGSGDVGMALWRSKYNVVSQNHCDRNHGAGIDLLSDEGSLIVGNACSNNRQNYSGTLSAAYGGIRVEQDIGNGLDPTTKAMVVGNHCYDDQATATQDFRVVVEAGNQAFVADNWGVGNISDTNDYQGNADVTEQILHSPDGSAWAIAVSDAGVLTANLA